MNNTNQENGKATFDTILSTITDFAESLMDIIFGAMHTMFFNGLAYSMIGLVVLFYLITRLGKGGFDREEIYKALMWIVTVAVVYTIMYSPTTYYEFLTILDLPAEYAIGGLGSFFTQGNEISSILGNGFDKINTVWLQIFDTLANQGKGDSGWIGNLANAILEEITPNFIAIIIVFVNMTLWNFVWLCYAILLLGLACLIIISSFFKSIVLCLAPIVIPCLMIPQLKPYFFSWLKLYISYCMYAPMGLFIATFPINLLEKLEININGNDFISSTLKTMSFLFWQPLFYVLISFLGIYLMKRIPSWVNQILGTQNNDNAGAGAAMALGKAAVGIAGSMAGGFIGAKLAGSTAMGALGKGLMSGVPFGKGMASRMNDKLIKSKEQQALQNAISSGITTAIEGYYKGKN